jgi:hypothetical protein
MQKLDSFYIKLYTTFYNGKWRIDNTVVNFATVQNEGSNSPSKKMFFMFSILDIFTIIKRWIVTYHASVR